MISLRQAKLSDIPLIMKIEKLAFIPEIQEIESVFENRIKLCSQLFLIILVDNNPAGYLCAERFDEIPRDFQALRIGHEPKDSKGTVIYVSSFAILPDFRNKGVGKSSWNLCIDYLSKLPDAKTLLLHVNENWNGAYHIYKSSGFTEIKRLHDFYNGENNTKSDAIVMKKELN